MSTTDSDEQATEKHGSRTVDVLRVDVAGDRIDEMRHALLLPFAVGTSVVLWLWYVSHAQRYGGDRSMRLADLAVLALCSGIAAALLSKDRHPRMARWVFLITSLISVLLVQPLLPQELFGAVGFLWLVMVCSLLSSLESFAALAILLGLEALSARYYRLEQRLFLESRGLNLFYIVFYAVIRLANRPLGTAVQETLAAWDRGRSALAEVRLRRGELRRTLHALEEATYRIERMNNELLLAQRDAERARAAKSRFAAAVSHELRGPLNLILGFSRMIALEPERYRAALPTEYRDDIDTIYSSSELVVDLLDDILDLSQIETEEFALVKDQIDLEKEVIAQIVEMVQPLAVRKGLYLRVRSEQDLPPIAADGARLRQVLMNLLTNAIRFTKDGGILVETTSHDDGILVSVSDTGRGIAEDKLANLFQEFSRPQADQGDEAKGTGLGLAISKRIIDLHGGRIWADTSLGEGTKISFILPITNITVTQRRREQPHATRRTEDDYRTCLVIHRKPDVIRLVARHLTGYHVVGMCDERDIMSAIESLHPRALITSDDLAESIVPQIVGEPWDVPVISCRFSHASESGPSRGAQFQLMKPVLPETLNAVMRQVVSSEKTDRSVLIVDDDPDSVRLLQRMLEALPGRFRISKAYAGAQALEMMRREVPGVVLLDLLMPETNGQEVITHMRASPDLRQVPVVVVSACDTMDEATALRPPVVVWSRQPWDMRSGILCLRAILDSVTPNYVANSTRVVSPESASLNQSAS